MTYTTTLDGTRIAYQLQGNGAPLVLLAGQPNNHHWWDPVRADFHPTRSTLTLGCTSPGGPHSIERGKDVRQALAQPQPGAARQALLELM